MCFAWSEHRCTKGDTCKFLHDGPGATQKTGKAYSGRKFQCLSFKTKGKCSKGTACQFLHVARIKNDNDKHLGIAKDVPLVDDINDSKKRGVCNNFKSKQSCRRGDACPYSHDIKQDKSTSIATSTSASGHPKRKRIDGTVLVEKRTKGLHKIFISDEATG